jgi:hypothetical protein
MQIGNIPQDDLYQLLSMGVCLVSAAIWFYVMAHSHSPLFFIPPIMASLLTFLFYFFLAFYPMSTLNATTLSAARTLADMLMWLLSGATMVYMQRHRVVP